MYMVMLVLDVPEKLDAVLDAWQTAGVSGTTIAETAGVHRRRVRRPRVPAPYAIGGSELAGHEGNYTLWAIVPDEEGVQTCLTEAEKILGNLDDPDTGVLAAWPLARVKGVPLRPAAPEGGEGAWSG
jgi:hypothetical protein